MAGVMMSSEWSDSQLERSDLHLSEAQGDIESPVCPSHTVPSNASQVTTVQVGPIACSVPPCTVPPHCTWAVTGHVVVLVPSAELLTDMICQWITFTHHVIHSIVSQIHWYHGYVVKLSVAAPEREKAFSFRGHPHQGLCPSPRPPYRLALHALAMCPGFSPQLKIPGAATVVYMY